MKKPMTPQARLLTALRGEMPDRVPCFPSITRWARYHYHCCCPRHHVKVAEDYGLDVIALYGAYMSQSVSNNYLYAPGGGYSFNAQGFYGDLPGVNVEVRVENQTDHVWYYRSLPNITIIVSDKHRPFGGDGYL